MTTRKPTLEGPAAKGWQLDRSKYAHKDPAQECQLTTWIVQRPGAHPFWEHWVVSVIHLRDIPGVGAAHKTYPAAGYELTIATLNPEKFEGDIDDAEVNGFGLLQPFDVTFQFDGIGDADAVILGRLVVEHIARGGLSPDQDFRSAWEVTLANTVKCIKSGKHVIH